VVRNAMRAMDAMVVARLPSKAALRSAAREAVTQTAIRSAEKAVGKERHKLLSQLS